MTEARDFDDQSVISATTVETAEDGNSRLAITLPSGRVLRSDAAPLSELQRQMITWCNAVRNQVNADAAEAAASAKRTLPVEAVVEGSISRPPPAKEASLTPDGVAAYAQQRIAALNSAMEEHAAAIQLAEVERDHWRRVVKALEGYV